MNGRDVLSGDPGRKTGRSLLSRESATLGRTGIPARLYLQICKALPNSRKSSHIARRHEPTDASQETIKDLLSGKNGKPGRSAAESRRMIKAVLFVLKTGISWEDLPARFG
ncbi:transposase [Lacunimicrobium album]